MTQTLSLVFRRYMLIIAMVIISFALLPPEPVGAHAFLVDTRPQAGERLDASPQSIRLLFSEPIAGGEKVAVATASGDPVAVGLLERLEGGTVIRVQLPPLEDDVYVVSWQVLAEDGHLSVGEFAFALGSAGEIPGATAEASSDTAWLEAGAGWLALIGLLLAFGGLASERVVWEPLSRSAGQTTPRLPAGGLLILALLGSILQLLLIAGQTAVREPPLPGWPTWSAVLATRPGLLLAAELVLIAWALWMLLAPRLRLWALLPSTAAIVVAAVRGHAGATEDWWAAPANSIHLLAVGFWVGALSHLVLIAWRHREGDQRPLLIDGVRRYSAIALGMVIVVLASGTVSALAQLELLSDLYETRYGQVLLIKLGIVVVTLGLAYAARRFALPTRRRGTLQIGLLEWLTRIETVALVLALAAAAVLANTAAPRPAGASANLLGPPPLAEPVLRFAAMTDLLGVHLAATEDQLQIRLIAPSNEPARDSDVTIEGQRPDGTGIDVTPRRCGPGCFTSAFSWLEGTTNLSVTARSEAWGEGRVEFAVLWPPEPGGRALLDAVIAAMRGQPEVTVNEHVASGPDASAQSSFTVSGERFIELELYAAGGASDIHPLPAPGNGQALTLYLPGSSIWFYLEIDRENRIQREVIVSAGHLIERSFHYNDAETSEGSCSVTRATLCLQLVRLAGGTIWDG